MGKTGLSAAKVLKKLKAKVFCWDDNEKVRRKIKKLNFKVNKFWLNRKLKFRHEAKQAPAVAVATARASCATDADSPNPEAMLIPIAPKIRIRNP